MTVPLLIYSDQFDRSRRVVRQLAQYPADEVYSEGRFEGNLPKLLLSYGFEQPTRKESLWSHSFSN